jgi:excisionase family DNA binding protein
MARGNSLGMDSSKFTQILPENLTTREATQVLRCCPHTLRRLELRGVLHAYRPFGRRKLYRRSDIERLIGG